MPRPVSLLALLLALGACANDPAPMPATEAPAPVTEPVTVGPPAAVVEAFRTEHPAAAGLEWSREDGGFEASFVQDGAPMSVVYAADGTPGPVETGMPASGLPPAVTAALARDYAGIAVTEAARIVTDGQTTYEAELTENGVARDLIFREDGTIFREDGTLVESAPAEAD